MFGAKWRCLRCFGLGGGVWGVLGWEEPFLAGSQR